MTNRQIFTAAWSIARNAASQFGGSPRQFFAEALRMAYANVRRAAKLAELRTSLNVAASRAYTRGASSAQIGLIMHLADTNNDFNILSGGLLTKSEASNIIDMMKRDAARRAA